MKKIINVINSKVCEKNPPIWIMRQAGRYLPEYREIRNKVDNFLDLCYNPKLASEVTLQPLTRFDFDAGIIFSDILVIPDALGIKVEFVKNHGPKLAEFSLEKDLKNLRKNNFDLYLSSVYEAINLTKAKLKNHQALIGFAGAPWTLACYILEGGGSKNFDKVKKIALQDPENFAILIDILTNAVIEFLSKQIQAGVDIVKIFDSWAGIIPPIQLSQWVINPAKKIIDNLKQKFPNIPVIYFPKNIGVNYSKFYQITKPDVLAVDQNLDLSWINQVLQQQDQAVIQGNLDNFLLAFGTKQQIVSEVENILMKLNNHPFIFNLGHGILPETPIENVELLLNIIRR
jgi:uroporphyrinogen decarboxylase